MKKNINRFSRHWKNKADFEIICLIHCIGFELGAVLMNHELEKNDGS